MKVIIIITITVEYINKKIKTNIVLDDHLRFADAVLMLLLQAFLFLVY